MSVRAHGPVCRRKSAVVAVSPLLRELIVRASDLGMLDERETGHRALADLIILELRVHAPASLDLPMPPEGVLREVAEHLSALPAARTGNAALARRFGLGTRSLERAFAAETGLSLGQWRRQARLQHALRELGAGASVKAAARATGYRSPSAFIAAFRAALGTTPARYFEGRRE